MTAVVRAAACGIVLALMSAPGLRGMAQQPSASSTPRPDVDVRDAHQAAPPLRRAAAGRAAVPDVRRRAPRFNRDSGSVRVLDGRDLPRPADSSTGAVRALLAAHAHALGLQAGDLAELIAVREYTSRSTGVRHVLFRQFVDGRPVFDSAIGVHLRRDGSILRITSNAAPAAHRVGRAPVSRSRARTEAAAHAGGPPPAGASLVWLPVAGALRLAWHSTVAADSGDLYDVLIDGQTADLLVRRNRVRYADGFGRIVQTSGLPGADPRQPDPMPLGAGGGPGCPPPVNLATQSLNAPFRDAGSVLDSTGSLAGNNVRIYRRYAGNPSASGIFDGTAWLFDFPFNTAGSAETFLFFAMNFAHDFFYDLGFDEPAGNFQVNNFGRGGLDGDPVRANARANGRNNANYVHAADGSSPSINMYLWDAAGCWGADVDGDGTADLDGDYDLDIVIHEYHHGVSLRLNTAFTGSEAGAIGEGGGDFFAYSVNGNELLAEYARPGGLRRVNEKGYGDWSCQFGLFCSVHDNGEIWANVLWDVRERFRGDLVRGSEGAAIHESHQIYIDALTLSPPAPTMLDMRDAMIEVDALRSPSGEAGANHCRLWESFAGRGMGVGATDTADNGYNRVEAAYDVPDGCTPPPPPPTVTVRATTAQAFEAGGIAGVFTFERSGATHRALTVRYATGGTATAGYDYAAAPGLLTFAAGSATATVSIDPIDDALVEGPESVTATISAGGSYIPGTPSSASITIVSDDVAPDVVVTELAVSPKGAAGGTIQVTETTRNQGTGRAAASMTRFYLSSDALLGAGDTPLGGREIAELAPGDSSSGTSSLTLPASLEAGTYYLFAKADGDDQLNESSETNNARAGAVAVGPDLVVSALSAPATAAPGGSIVVSDTTANQGAGSAAASRTVFYLSQNALFDPSDVALQGRTVPALEPDAASTASITVTLPAGLGAGSYYLFARADAPGEIGETSEANNQRAALLRVGPDLTVSSLTAPGRAAAGGPLAIADTTRNSGAGLAAASSTAFYLSADLTLDASDYPLLPARPVPALGTNEASSATTTVTLPEVAAGLWYLLASADADGAVPETQEHNNVRFTSVRVGPDLTLFSLSSPSSAAAGTAITVTTAVRNLGANAAGPSAVWFYLSSNYTLDAADVRLDATRAVPAVAAGATDTGSTAVPLPSAVSGTFYLIAVADGGGQVDESSEANNVAARVIQID